MTWYKSIFGLLGEKVVYRTGSQFNPILEVIRNGNHLKLDTLHMNYSFGELHKSFQQLFIKMDIGKADPGSVLILGFGAGSIASILQNEYKLNCTITGIEIDPEVIALGSRFFETNTLSRLTLLEEDAFRFMERNHAKFDLVVVDLYVDMDVPGQAEKQDFILRLRDALTTDGQLVFNKFVYDIVSGKAADKLSIMLKGIFGSVTLYKTGHDHMNSMFVCKNTGITTSQH
jgi:spermidine synthase